MKNGGLHTCKGATTACLYTIIRYNIVINDYIHDSLLNDVSDDCSTLGIYIFTERNLLLSLKLREDEW